MQRPAISEAGSCQHQQLRQNADLTMMKLLNGDLNQVRAQPDLNCYHNSAANGKICIPKAVFPRDYRALKEIREGAVGAESTMDQC